jgi:preprotein translocase subunit YajC
MTAVGDDGREPVEGRRIQSLFFLRRGPAAARGCPSSHSADRAGVIVFISSAFAQAAPAAAGGDMQSSFMSLLPLVLMFVVLYFVMIRPQMKRQKEHKSMIEALAKGDEVATSGGLVGRVTKLGDNYLSVEVAPGVEVQVQRTAVVQVLPKGSLK